MLDKLSEKIDYMFRRGKNADERTFDFFLRSVTFFIILLAVLTYGGLVKASSGVDSPFTDSIDISKFLNSSLVAEFYSDNYDSPLVVSSDFTKMFTSVMNPDPFNDTYFSDFENYFNNSVSTYEGSYSNRYVVILCNSSTYSFTPDGLNRFNVLEIFADDLPILVDKDTSYINRTLTSYCIYCPNGCYVNSYSFKCQRFSNGSFNFQKLDEYNYSTLNSLGCVDIGSNYDNYGFICYSDLPIYSFIYSNIYSDNTNQSKEYSTLSSFLGAIDTDSVYQLNPYNDYFNPSNPEEEVESDANNLYLDEVQIGLTSVTNNQDLLSSEVAIGVSTSDDYILNHLDNFELNMDFKLHIKDTFASSPNDPGTDYYITYPLRAFLNEPVTVSIIEIMRNSIFPSGSTYSNFYQYYTDLLNQNNYHVVSEGTFRGVIPIITKTAYDILFGNFHIVQPDLPNYTIFDFNLEVTCWLTSINTLDESGNYSKKFDFLNGSESITAAGLLNNYNPWLGTQEPSASPIIPSSGSSVGGSSGGNNVNVKVDVSGQKVPMNVNNQQEIQRALDSYTDVTEHFTNLWGDISNQNSNSSFLAIINNSLAEIPYMNYMIKCAMVIFGMAVILFVLKVLLF